MEEKEIRVSGGALSGVTESIAKNGKAAVVQIHSRLDDGLSELLAG